jgi:hypothetical protein
MKNTGEICREGEWVVNEVLGCLGGFMRTQLTFNQQQIVLEVMSLCLKGSELTRSIHEDFYCNPHE